jgi:hypothetical protein
VNQECKLLGLFAQFLLELFFTKENRSKVEIEFFSSSILALYQRKIDKNTEYNSLLNECWGGNRYTVTNLDKQCVV